MYFIYNLIVHIAWFHLRIVALFHPKIKLFVEGRKKTFAVLNTAIFKKDQVVWIHVASLGEFEQGLPVIEKLKLVYPSHKILVTFFSPSGYEVKKNTTVADVVTYLPLDSKKNVEEFLALARPKLAIFVKYEIWPNYLRALQKDGTPTLLISAIFKQDQVYFKWYGGFMRKALSSFSHFFVQDKNSEQLLGSINLKNVSISGDTRFDRVSEILERDNSLEFMAQFKQDQLCLVAGSTWPEDEVILIDYINTSPKPLKYVLAPHNNKVDHIRELKASIAKKTILFSEIQDKNLSSFEVLIVDTIGLLTKIYSYADIAYVGGGFATGLHNTLEPAVFGIPVIIGPNYKGFKEAEDLVDGKGVLVVDNHLDFGHLLNRLMDNPAYLEKTGKINAAYVSQNKGASIQIIDHIRTLL